MKFKGLKKSITLISIFLIFTISGSGIVNAEEMGIHGGYRWAHTEYNNGVKRARVKISGYLLNDEFGARYNAALSEWNNNSGGKAYFVDTVFSSSNCDTIVPMEGYDEATQQDVDYWYLGHLYLGGTFLRNSAGQWNALYDEDYIDETTGEISSEFDGPFQTGQATYAIIYLSPRVALYYDNQHNVMNGRIDYTLRHEMGHVLGLGHTPNTTYSIMYKTFRSYPTTNIQAHDRNVLNSFYPN